MAALDWINCHLKPTDLGLGSYGGWLGGTVLVAAVYWAYEAAWQQRRAVFQATMGHYHARFRDLATWMSKDLQGALGGGPEATDVGKTAEYIEWLEMHRDAGQVSTILSRTVFAADYVRLAKEFIAALETMNLTVYRSGDWLRLLEVIERSSGQGQVSRQFPANKPKRP